MGLFDAFGVGGGSLSIQMQGSQAQAGGAVSGTVVYTSGRRAQQITNIKVRLSRTIHQPSKGPNGVQQNSRVESVVPEFVLTGGFTAQPGQNQQFPFQMQIPPGSPGSVPGTVSYAVSASADIDGEVDPGAHAEIQVFGAAFDPYAQGGGYVDPNAGYGKVDPYAKADPYGKGGGGYVDPNAGYGKADPYAKADPYGKGGGGYVDPNAGYGKADPYAKGGGGYVDPNAGYGKADPNAKGGGYVDPNAGYGKADPYGKGGGGYVDPNAGYGKADPYAKGGGGAYGKGGGGIGVGAHVQAQWSDGQYYGATVQQEGNGMFLVQWDDGSPAMWLRGDQVSPG